MFCCSVHERYDSRRLATGVVGFSERAVATFRKELCRVSYHDSLLDCAMLARSLCTDVPPTVDVSDINEELLIDVHC